MVSPVAPRANNNIDTNARHGYDLLHHANNANIQLSTCGQVQLQSRHIPSTTMREHPLPALPHEDKDEVQSKPRDETDVRVEPGSEHASISKESENAFALFDDTSEINLDLFARADDDYHNLRTFLHAKAPLNGSKVPQQRLSEFTTHEAHSSGLSATPIHLSTGTLTRGASNAPKEPDNVLRVNCDESTFAYHFRRASLDAVCDYAPDAPHVEHHHHRRSSSDYGPLHDASTDEDDEPHHKPLVRFADAHTILCTPLSPKPPPQQTFSYPIPLTPPVPIRRTELSYTASVPDRFKPYGPRLPPWGSTDNLDRERRLRTDIRRLEDPLDEHFDERDRLRKAEEARKGQRRTEGDELRELVLGIYPELEETEKDRGRSCWMCAVM
ncbi:uncharacterized protein N0V89_001290 [Didymosphaeria variabile]|uniref:Uncharacterized protein n=1 Tax=Didymosphaeria variabile TaxID=1932322 RepID=A0A9W9CFR5_9PLEO|nr:uncharacterized protein N0V89_001290 [Didymosphaeria variabile]KAJ4360723.1 hypothetical protein N0V89_001290 [Didymosphaeria variabile]